MRKLLTSLFVLSSLAAPAVGQAANGVVDMTWGVTCTPIVSNITPTAGPTSLMFSVLGNDQTHNAYQVRFLLGNAAQDTPDAWRFDASGCQTGALITINHIPPAAISKTCPAFKGTTSSLELKQYEYSLPSSGYSTTTMLGACAVTYPAGFTSLPGTRYFLAQFIFDHTFSVSGAGTPGTDCGGFETPICIALLQSGPATSTYLRQSDGVEVPFDFSTNNFATTLGLGGCPGVPAKSTTWGSVKSQYRN